MIVGIHTTGIGPMDVGGSKAGKVKEQAEKKASDAFASLMNLTQNTQNQEVPSGSDALKPVVQKADTANSYYSGNVASQDSSVASQGKNSGKVNTDDVSPAEEQADKSEPVQKKETSDAKQTSDKTKVDQTHGDKTEVQEGSEKLQETLTAWKEEIMSTLQLSEEELGKLLEDAGITMLDLLNPDVLKSFILKTQNATEVDMLINEDLNQLVNQLLQDLDVILEKGDFQSDMLSDVAMQTVFTVQEEMTGDEDMQVQMAQEEVDTNQQKTADTQTQWKHETVNSQVKVEVQGSSQQEQSFQNLNQDASGNADALIDNLNQALNQVVNTEGINRVEFSETMEQVDIVRQVVDEIRANITKEVTSLSIRLNPEQLGNVQITVATRNGMMQARIIAETEAAKNAIENNLAILKETFEQQDLKVDAIEVMVGTGEFFAETEQQTGEEQQERNTENRVGGINLNTISDDEISEDIELEVEMMKAQGNSVSYTV